MTTLIVFLLALMVLVFIHEWGHFIVAKINGIRVDVFSIGFGPRLVSFKWRGTEYRLSPIPLGGYVKIYGHEPLEEAEGDEAKAEEIARDPEAYASKSIGQRLAVVVAGPFMNFVLCFAVLPLMFLVGRHQPKVTLEPPIVKYIEEDSPAEKIGLRTGDRILFVDGTETPNWHKLITAVSLRPNNDSKLLIERDGKKMTVPVRIEENPMRSLPTGYLGIEVTNFFDPILGDISDDSAAKKAGLKLGDQILAVNGKAIEHWNQITSSIQRSQPLVKSDQEVKARTIPLKILRDGQEQMISLTPHLHEESGRWRVGILPQIPEGAEMVPVRYGFVDSVRFGFREGVNLTFMIFETMARLATGQLSFKSLGGPIQIAKATGSAAETGFGNFLFILAFLSLNLGVMNLMPVPVLDGGHAVFLMIEGLARRPVPYRFKAASMYVGLFMILGLMAWVTINDVNQVWGLNRIYESVVK